MRLLTIWRQDDGVRSVNPCGDELQVHRGLVDGMDGPFVGVDLEDTMPYRPFDQGDETAIGFRSPVQEGKESRFSPRQHFEHRRYVAGSNLPETEATSRTGGLQDGDATGV